MNPGGAAALAASWEESKYRRSHQQSCLLACCIGNLGNNGFLHLGFFWLGRRFTDTSDDPNQTLFMFQWLSVIIQCFNCALVHQSFIDAGVDLDFSPHILFLIWKYAVVGTIGKL